MALPCSILYLTLVCCAFNLETNGQDYTRRELTSYLLNTTRYDPHIVPDFDEDYPTTVTIQITIHDIHSISETTMDYSIDAYLRMWWRDERLDFRNISIIPKLELDTKNIGNVWQPDVFFENEKRAYVHTVTTSNKLMHIHRNGTVVYSSRLSLTLGCIMLLHYYPFDSQRCPLYVQSFGYTKDNINLDWHLSNPVTAEHLIMPQFSLANDDVITTDYESTYSATGLFSTLKAELFLSRKIGFYFLQVFVPSVLLVILSWVSFWVDPSATPARVSLGVTCVLTMTTQSSGIRQSLPPVAYVKAIDIWMLVCLLYVFAALLEYAYINVILRRAAKHDKSEEHELGSVNGQISSVNSGLDTKTEAKRVDIISRFLFPVTFALFLCIFFAVCGLAPNPKVGDS